MRCRSLAALLAAGMVFGQSYRPVTNQVGGPGGYSVLDYAAVPGGSNASGDTWFFTAWMSNGDVYGLLNDGHIGGSPSGSNIQIVKLAALDLTNPAGSNTTRITLVNEMNDGSAYGYGNAATGNTNGWPTTNGCAGNNCSWKSSPPLALNGCMYVAVHKQDNNGPYKSHDTTLIKSCDNGATWVNPAHVAIAGYCNDNTPPHNRAACLVGDAPMWADVASAMILPGAASNNTDTITRLMPIVMCQDGAGSCPTPDGTDLYQYFYGMDSGYLNLYLVRILKTDLPDLPLWTSGKWSVYAGSGSWSTSLASRAVVAPAQMEMSHNGNGQAILNPARSATSGNCTGWVVYLKDLGIYVDAGGYGGWAPHPWGPWQWSWRRDSTQLPWSAGAGFDGIIPSTYSLIGSDPPHVRYVASISGGAGSGHYNPFFVQYDVQVAPPANQGTTLMKSYPWSMPIRASMGPSANAIPRQGLTYFADFYDHGGDVTWPSATVTDVIGKTMSVTMYDGGGDSFRQQLLGAPVGNTQCGIEWLTTGLHIGWRGDGAGIDCQVQGVANPLSGDSGYTIFALFSPAAPTVGWTGTSLGIIAQLGDNSDTNHGINLYLHANGAGSVSIGPGGWGGNTPAGTVTTGATYLVVATKTPGPFESTSALWLSTGAGSITKRSLSYTGSGTPDISAGQIRLAAFGNLGYGGCSGTGCAYRYQFGGVLYGFGIYQRVLSPMEIGRLYSALAAWYKLPPRNLAIP